MRVLVVEDEPDLRRVLAQALREAGYAVDEAADGEDGLYKAISWEYDALVLDLMLPRLCVKRQQRTIFARLGERDVGYVLGAVFGEPDASEYRGLQFSYDDDVAKLGVGSLLQYHQIVELCADGIGHYDLGTEMDYKRRWAEEVMETEMLVLVR